MSENYNQKQAPSRRAFLSDFGLGCTGMALGAMLAEDGIVKAETAGDVPSGIPHIKPRAKSVIWVFLSGGYSHMETFDPKPALDKYSVIGSAATFGK